MNKLKNISTITRRSLFEELRIYIVIDGNINNAKLFKNEKEAEIYANHTDKNRILIDIPVKEYSDKYLYVYKDSKFSIYELYERILIPNSWKYFEIELIK